MAINEFRFNLDIEKDDYISKFKVKQYDTAIFYVNLLKNGSPFSAINQTIKIFVKKSDGTIVYQEDEISLENSTVKIKVRNQAFTAPGITYAELELKSTDGQVTTSTFLYVVKEKVGSDKAIESITDMSTLDKLNKYIEESQKELDKFKKELSKIEDLVANKDKLEGQNEDAKKNIVELEKVLEDANNITSDEGKYITGNNVVSESTNGYIQDIKLYGKTMFNTCSNDYTKTNIGIYYNTINSNLVKTGDIIAIKIFNNTGISGIEWGLYGMPTGGSNSVPIVGYNKNFGKHVITLPSGYEFYRVYVRQYDGTQYVDFDISKIKACIVKGNVEIGPFFEGIASVGNGNEIEVSSIKWSGNLFNEEQLKPYIKSENETECTIDFLTIWDRKVKLSDLPFKENTSYKFICTQKCSDGVTKPRFYLHYTDGTEDNVTIANTDWATVTAISRPNKTLEYISATYGNSGGTWTIKKNSICLYEDTSKTEYETFKQDKKTILFKDADNKWKPVTNLSGYWENEKFVWGDTIELHSNGKYYLHIRTKPAKGTDLIGLVKEQNFPNRDGYYGFLPNKEGIKLSVPDKSNPYIICDKLKSVGTYIIAGSQYSDVDCISYDPKYQCIRLSVPKETNINTYLAEKNITFILPIDEKVYECLDISTRAFRNKTLFSVNSGPIDPGIFYYVPTGFLSADNSISEKVETLDKYSEQNIKDLEDLNSNMEQNYFNISRGYVNDFNDAIQEGKYFIRSWDWLPNCPPIAPEGLYGILQVMYKSEGELFQFVTLHTMESWARFRNAKGLWSSWYKTVTLKDFETQHGSTGFVKFPNDSVLQFGSGMTNNGVLHINFKLSFARSDTIVISGSALDPSPQTVGFRNLTTTECELTCSWNLNPVGVKWFAFGEIQ